MIMLDGRVRGVLVPLWTGEVGVAKPEASSSGRMRIRWRWSLGIKSVKAPRLRERALNVQLAI